MSATVTIENGFAEVGPGLWLMGCGQPAAFFGRAVSRRRRGWFVRDRAKLGLVETDSTAKCADSSRPFLTHIPCAAPIFAVSGKVLVAPAASWAGAQSVKSVPMSIRYSICATEFRQPDESPETGGAPADKMHGQSWVVMATAGRTARTSLEEGESFSVRPESVVAWTGRRPTGFCPKLRLRDMLLPRGPRNMLFTFYGPGIVWFEGSAEPSAIRPSTLNFRRRGNGF